MLFKNKLFTILALALLFSNSVSSQIYGKVLQFRPTGDFGFIAEKAIGGEIGYLEEFDSPFRSRAYVNFASFKSRMDIFPGVGYSNQEGPYKFYPGENQYRTLMNLIFGVGYDYSPEFFDDFKLRPYIGADLNVGIHLRETNFHNPAISNVTETSDGLIGGVKGRVGLQYAFENSGFFIDFTRTYAIIVPFSFANFNDFGLGFYYYF